MLSSRPKACFTAGLAALIASALPLHATTTPLAIGFQALPSLPSMIGSNEPALAGIAPEAGTLRSLKEDVRRHPEDFVTFETHTAAERFIADHWTEAQHETEQRVIRRGIVGYWRNKTLVVLPSLSTAAGW